MSLKIKPITFRNATDFVKKHHRHHGAPAGCKWSIAAYENERLCGVAICSRPVARALDDGKTCEIVRLCTDGTRNACSLLYGACAKVAKAMGYEKIITYILAEESGISLKASGFRCESESCGGGSWDCPSRPRNQKAPTCEKQRWVRVLHGGVSHE